MAGTVGDVLGIKAGNSQDLEGMTGVTVVLCEKGARAGISVMGGAPGTRETDLLRPTFSVDVVHAVFLAGGSAFGLEAAGGIVRYLEERRIGYHTGIAKVPIVSGAVLFDLGVGSPAARPDPQMAYDACRNAGEKPFRSGSVGAGTGATVGKIFGFGYSMKSGLGNSFAKTSGGYAVGCVMAVNAWGNVWDPGTGRIVAGAFDRAGNRFVFKAPALTGDNEDLEKPGPATENKFLSNTTIGIVATDADLTKEECNRVAIMAMGGVAQAIRPCFTPFDGDSLFVLSTGQHSRGSYPKSSVKAGSSAERAVLVAEIGTTAQTIVPLAIVDAVMSCSGLPTILCARDLKDSPPSHR